MKPKVIMIEARRGNEKLVVETLVSVLPEVMQQLLVSGYDHLYLTEG